MDKWKANPFEDLFGYGRASTEGFSEELSQEDIRQATEATNRSGLTDDGMRRHFYDTFLEARKARNLRGNV